jgi:serine protease Do
LSPLHVPGLGDAVFTIGYPTPDLLGTDPKYTNGTVSALSGLRGDASYPQISVPIQPGHSGGPLINEEGDVIGVVVARR